MHEAKNLAVWCIVVLNSNVFHFELDLPLWFNGLYVCMGAKLFISGCGTVVYTLNCENVHSSASDSGNIGFIGSCLTSKIPWPLLGFQTESDSIEFTCEEKGRSESELATSHPPDSHNPLSHAMREELGNEHWKTALHLKFPLLLV